MCPFMSWEGQTSMWKCCSLFCTLLLRSEPDLPTHMHGGMRAAAGTAMWEKGRCCKALM